MDRVRILLVEDDWVIRKVAAEMLNKLRVTLDVAFNGQDAIELLRVHRYDLIFMDCHMPVMDGFETTLHLRAGGAGEMNRTTPVVALTANATPGNREMCLAAGMNEYLTKPVKFHELKTTVDALVPASKLM